jgi:serine kinase of HPr protein (carbohydrate metabolism regulator)
MLVHATTILVDDVGVLLRGPSGSGKSDLALRMIDRGARLVADDQTELRCSEGTLVASAPANLAGLIEVRGIGIVRLPAVASARLGLVVDLVRFEEVERLPEINRLELLGISLPWCRLPAFAASTSAKIRLAVVCGKMDIIAALTDP